MFLHSCYICFQFILNTLIETWNYLNIADCFYERTVGEKLLEPEQKCSCSKDARQRSLTVTAFGNGARESTMEKTKHYVSAGDCEDLTKNYTVLSPSLLALKS